MIVYDSCQWKILNRGGAETQRSINGGVNSHFKKKPTSKEIGFPGKNLFLRIQ